MRETTQTELKSALYGVLRIVCGYKDWKLIEHLEDHEWIPTLIQSTTEEVVKLNADPNVDPKLMSQYMRKLRAYQQLSVVDNFCFKEVEWD
jgi:hypothetical protein